MSPKRRSDDAVSLARYRARRAASRTPEPFGGMGPARRTGLFVVHKHAATRLHWDLRLELDGVLRSWAVPRGPSLDPDVKRLAVAVEDHPVDYAEFEGVIPDDNYGAGAIVLWDRGRWEPVEDPLAGLRDGKLLFDLYGSKLRGRFTLFRTARAANEWLLMKKPDAFAIDPGEPDAFDEASIVSGLTVEQVRDGHDPTPALVRRARRAGARAGAVDAATVRPMLARAADAPFDRAGWLFELKYDGYRMIVGRDDDRVLLRWRGGGDVTALFPEIAALVRRLPVRRFVLDGEAVALDPSGRPNFQRLQRRARLRSPRDVERAAIERPATLFAFDLLALDGLDLRPLPLGRRKALLRSLLPAVGTLRYSDHVVRRGTALWKQVRRLHLEGVVAKREAAPYAAGRSADWLKLRADRTADLVAVGLAPGTRSRGWGSLHVAAAGRDGLVWAGRVGSGFAAGDLDRLADEAAPARGDRPPCAGAPPTDGDRWIEPTTVCEVRFKEWTADGRLRQPVFLRVRDDRTPADATPAPEAGDDDGAAGTAAPAAEPAERVVRVTNADKVFWPDDGLTKGDLVAYYRAIAPWLLPYLADRPLVLTRYPDGIDGKHFFQKDAPAFTPAWFRTTSLWSESTSREVRYLIADDADALAWIANLGTIPLHLWSARSGDPGRPDWCVLDLDPKDAPFQHVVTIARALHDLASAIDLPCHVKTSGSTGLHVLIPLGGLCTHDQSRQLAEALARVVADELPDIATLRRAPARREGRVYLDALQNGQGKLIVAPFAVRALPGAPVSTPLRWREVRPGLDIRRFTIRSVPRRMRALRDDPLAPVLGTVPDLTGALERLARRLEG